MTDRFTSIRLVLAGFLLMLLFGCALEPRDERPAYTPMQSRQLAEAAALESRGDFAAAAAIYEKLAGTTAPPQRDEWLLWAADAYVQGGDYEAAGAVLKQVNRNRLTGHSRLLASMIEAEILLAASRPDAALRSLPDVPPAEATPPLQARFHRIRAEAFRLNGDLLASARELSALDPLLEERDERSDIQLQLLKTLTVLPDRTLARRVPSDTFAGWLDLARVLKASGAQQNNAALTQWRARHPLHPASPELFKRYLAAAGIGTMEFRQIAVLLPTSGRFAAAAAALRDGLLAAYYAAPLQGRPQLRFYDTSNIPEIWPLLQQAVAEGAEAAIGPLQKKSVEQLARGGELEIPVLALNRVSGITAPPANLFQFGLAPEDEARAAAERAWEDGATSALILSPASDWGMRLARSFQERMEQLGGWVAGKQSYDPAKHDFTEEIRNLLQQNEVAVRHQAPMRTGGQRGRYEPERLNAVALFLASNADKARQIWPQLQFHGASDLPVYTTSHIYSGHFQHPQDLDLVGLRFPDMPWLLAPDPRGPVTPQDLPAGLATTRGALARLFALGMDSYRLLGHLQSMQDFPSTQLSSATGELSMDALNHIQRRLLWARMTPAGVRLLDVPAQPLHPAVAVDEEIPSTSSSPTLSPATYAPTDSRSP
jgi:outer membrane PBP1 activator LpoA protein